MEERFTKMSSAALLRKVYKANGLIGGFGAISLNTDRDLKRELIAKNSLSQLGSIKSGLVSSIEMFKQLGIMIAIVTFVVTTIFSTLPMYMPQFFKTVDWTHQLHLQSVESATTDMTEEEKQKYIAIKHDEEVKSYNQELNDVQTEHLDMLMIVILPMLGVIALAFFRFKWLLSVQACVNEAYQEKEKFLHEEKDKLRMIRELRESRLRR